MITILFVVSKCLAFLNGFLKKRKAFFNGNRYADNQYKILAYGLSVENFFFFFYMGIRHGKTGKNFLTRPDLTQTQFLTRSKNGLTHDPTHVFCGSTRPELELFFKTIFLGKKINRIKTILV